MPKSRKIRRNAAKKSIWHRPRVRVVGGHFKHAPNSRFFGTGSVMVNPRIKVRYKHRRRHGIRLNPFNVKGALRQVTNRKWLVSTAMIGGGIAAGMVAKGVSEKILVSLKQPAMTKYSGALSIVIGALAIAMGKKAQIKQIGAIIAGAGAYDLIAQNVTALKLPALPTVALPMPALPGAAAPSQPQSASYATAVRPVSPVARVGLNSSYAVTAPAGFASSYQANVPTQGFSGMENPYEGIDF